MESWKRKLSLDSLFNEIHLKISHAQYGELFPFEGESTLPVNRIYFALDHTGSITWGENKKLHLNPGTITFMPFNIPLSYNFKAGRMVAFHFNLEFFTNSDIFHGIRDCLQIEDLKSCELLNEKMHQSESLKNIISIQNEILKLAINFLDKDLSYFSKQIKMRDKHNALLQYIHNHIHAGLTIDMIADKFNVTRNQLSKSFSRDIGISLKKYTTNLLVKKASELLILDMSVKEVSKKLKFDNEFYFSRFFKKHTNLSPSLYKLNVEMVSKEST